jgi:hypothetical protein
LPFPVGVAAQRGRDSARALSVFKRPCGGVARGVQVNMQLMDMATDFEDDEEDEFGDY